jgi:hypothetical protein
MTTQLIEVTFHNQPLFATVIENIPYVAMKPICENLGLDWEGQRQKINRHPVLNNGACMIKAVADDGKLREMLMLPLRLLNGWLFGIDVKRVKAEIKPRLIEYQSECFEVLNNYFVPPIPKPSETPALTYCSKSQREPLIKAVRSYVKLSAEHGKPLSYSQAHTLINLKMGVEDVEHLTAEQLPLALKVVGELMADVIMRSDNRLAAPAQPLSITLTFPPLESQTSRRYLVIQSSDQQISSSLLNDDALIASRAEIINQLTQEGYVIFEKNNIGAAKLVREFVPAQLLPVLIETAQARWAAIAAGA